ncbi:MAG TPA: TonB-dependent receptor [Gemmatimonadaceae bacterium]|jgi:iron complex outermembrane receptor protein
MPRSFLSSRALVVSLVIASAFGAIAPLDAQSPTPSLRGTVKDSLGNPLANVQIIIASLSRSTKTNDSGQFRLGALPAGQYHVRTMLIGYAPGHMDATIPVAGPDVEVAISMRETPLQISVLQITASPIGSDPRDVPQSTVDLNGQALARQLGATVAQSLSSQPGVSMRFNGPAATAPVIRGLQGERVLVLEDGNRAGDLSSAAPDHGVSVDPLAAQRIEVVRGPASLLYGNQALGGVVNVISNDIPTSIPARVEGTLAANGESVSPGGAGLLSFTVPFGSQFALVAKGGGRRANDLRMGGGQVLPNSFYRNYYGVGGFGFNTGSANGGLAVREYQFQYGLPSADNERSKIDGHRHEIIGRTDITTASGPLTSVRFSGTAQWYGHSEINQLTNATNTSFDLKTQTLDVLARTQVGAIPGAVGVSGLFKQYAALGDEALTPAANSNGLGAFVFQEVPLWSTRGNADALIPKLQIGGRYDVYRIDIRPGGEKFDRFVGTRNFSEVSGSAGVTIPLSSVLTFSASTARAFRAPSVEELSSNAFHGAEGAFDVGNPNLKAEINQGVEAVLRLDAKRSNGQVSAFWNSVQNFITPNIVKDTTIDGDDGAIVVPLNQISQANAHLRGIEGQVETQISSRIVLGAMGDLVRGELAATGEPLPFMPAARLGGLARWDNGRFSAEGEFRHAFAQDRVPPAVSANDPAGIPSASYNLFNANVGWTLSRGGRSSSITLRADNLFDEKYVDATSRLKAFAFNPGRNLALLYRVQF